MQHRSQRGMWTSKFYPSHNWRQVYEGDDAHLIAWAVISVVCVSYSTHSTRAKQRTSNGGPRGSMSSNEPTIAPSIITYRYQLSLMDPRDGIVLQFFQHCLKLRSLPAHRRRKTDQLIEVKFCGRLSSLSHVESVTWGCGSPPTLQTRLNLRSLAVQGTDTLRRPGWCSAHDSELHSCARQFLPDRRMGWRSTQHWNLGYVVTLPFYSNSAILTISSVRYFKW